MDPVLALLHLGGAARRHQLRGLGVTGEALSAAVLRGAVVRPHRGCYALTDASPAVVRARVMSAQITCLSAARHYGLPLLREPVGLHLAIPGNRGIAAGDARATEGFVWHRAASTSDAWARPLAVIDALGRCGTAEQQLVAVDAALRIGLIRRDEIPTMTVTDTVRRAWLLRHADARAGSAPETLTRLALVRAGFALRSQTAIPGVGRVDFLVESRVIVEIDGFEFHRKRSAFEEDRRRDRAAEMAGIPRLRFPAAVALRDVAQIVDEVRTVVTRLSSQGSM